MRVVENIVFINQILSFNSIHSAPAGTCVFLMPATFDIVQSGYQRKLLQHLFVSSSKAKRTPSQLGMWWIGTSWKRPGSSAGPVAGTVGSGGLRGTLELVHAVEEPAVEVRQQLLHLFFGRTKGFPVAAPAGNRLVAVIRERHDGSVVLDR